MIGWFVRSKRPQGFNTKKQARKSEGHGAGKLWRFARRTAFGARVPPVTASAVIARLACSPTGDSQWLINPCNISDTDY